MQVARLCLRGNLVNYTAKNLNKDQGLDVDKITIRAISDPKIAPHRNEFRKQLARTIKGEYRDLPDAAETEFWIASWRAILSITYHSPLEIRAFGPVSIDDKPISRKAIAYDGSVVKLSDTLSITISEDLPIPPKHTIHIHDNKSTTSIIVNERGLLTNPNDDTVFVITRNGETIFGPSKVGKKSSRMIITGDFEGLINAGDIIEIIDGPDKGIKARIQDAKHSQIRICGPKPVVLGSNLNTMEIGYRRMCDRYSIMQDTPNFVVVPGLKPIHAIIRTKVADPSIIFDDEQMRKLIKNYGWEFFGQILKENKRPMTKITKIMKAPAESVALKLITSMFNSSKDSIKFEVVGQSLIKTETNMLPMSIVSKIGEAKREFLAYGVDIKAVENEGIYIKPIGETVMISKKVVDVQFAKSISFDEQFNDDNTIKDVLESQIADKTILSSDIESISNREAFEELFDRIPQNAIKYATLRMHPPKDFEKIYGSKPKKSDIAKYLGVSVNEIKRFESIIRLQMMALGMEPS